MEKKTLMLPCYFFVLYMLVALYLVLFGPWEYRYFDTQSKIALTVYILIFLIMAVWFYKRGINHNLKKITFVFGTKKNLVGNKFLYMNIIIGFLIVLLKFAQGIMSSSISFSGIASMVAGAYKNSHADIVTSTNLFDRLFIFGYGIIYYGLVGGLYKYKEIKQEYKFFVVGMFIMLAFNNLFLAGSNRGILEIAVIFLSVFFLKDKRKKFKFTKKKGILIVVISIVGFWLLSRLVYERVLMWGSISLSFHTHTEWVNLDNWMIKALPIEVAYIICLGISYFTQGMYGLSQCLKLPFVFCSGLGSSSAIRYYMERIGISIGEITYPERLESLIGWSSKARWHTIFPWFASDFTFIGALFIVCLFIYMFARVWKDAILNKNICAVILIPQFIIMLLFIPANNQIFITSSSLITFVYTSMIWMFF